MSSRLVDVDVFDEDGGVISGRVAGSRARASTPMEWPDRTCIFAPEVASQMMIVASAEPEIRIWDEDGKGGGRGATARHLTKSRWPWKRVRAWREVVLQDQILLSQLPA